MAPDAGPFRFAPPLWPSVFAALVLVLLCSLGFWQLERARFKTDRIAAFELARHEIVDPWTFPRGDEARLPPEFARVELTGRYDAARQFLHDNRTHGGRAGYHVLTPLRVAGGQVALINRGWVPAAPDRTLLPDIDAPAGEVRVPGLIRHPREDLFVLGETGYSEETTAPEAWPRVVQRIEIDPMRRLLGAPGLAPWLVALDPSSPDGYVREWQAVAGLPPSRHRAYAFQWFALATALVAIWVAVNLKRRGGGGEGRRS